MIITSSYKLRDWKALREYHDRVLLEQAKACGARRYALYRNLNDATRVLLIAEFAGPDRAQEFLGVWLEVCGSLCNDAINPTCWETLGWETLP